MKLSGLTLLSLLPLFCFLSARIPYQAKSQIIVSILPQKYFVERIAGEKWHIEVMIPPGHNPAVYEPAPVQMKNLSTAKIYFRVGHIGFERAWMENLKKLSPGMDIVDTSLGVDLIRVGNRVDPHIWLSPKAVSIIAANICRALEKADPKNKGFYQNNYRLFLSDIERLDSEIQGLLSKKKKKKFMVFHPAWTYFARDYDLTQVSIENEGKHPAPSDLKRMIDEARREGIRSIVVQAQFDTHSAETISGAIKGNIIRLDPLAEEWVDNMRTMARKINGLLQPIGRMTDEK